MPFWRPKFLKCQYCKPVSLFLLKEISKLSADYLQDRTCHRFYSPCSRLSTALLQLLWGESKHDGKRYIQKDPKRACMHKLEAYFTWTYIYIYISFQFPTSCGHPLSKYHEFPIYLVNLVLHLKKGSAACKKRVGIEMHAALQRAERSYYRDISIIGHNRRSHSMIKISRPGVFTYPSAKAVWVRMCSRAMAQSVQHQGQRLNKFDPEMELRAVMLSILVWSI